MWTEPRENTFTALFVNRIPVTKSKTLFSRALYQGIEIILLSQAQLSRDDFVRGFVSDRFCLLKINVDEYTEESTILFGTCVRLQLNTSMICFFLP